ncbi:hypothetical protein DE146DRAFT_616618 [Phaeosphaeria sp. MPI-PUGE-AT-0046c]|nr:hypothetical protein DE146DRAFT_616618 [Phaeosphaeria sp. MPI-PUGE-AT-0046c]
MERQPQLAHQVDDILRRIDSLRILAVKSDSSLAAECFTPWRALAHELSRDKIKIFLDYEGVRSANYEAIHDHYLAVFGTLIRIGKAGFIKCFTRSLECADRYLPFSNSTNWSPQCRDFFEDFEKAQWEFCALPFRPGELDDQLLRSSKILPITARTCLKKGPDSTVEQIQVHPDYDYLTDASALNTQCAHTYVLKTYDSKHKALFDNEIGAYKMLKHPDIAENIVHMYGSWSQNDMHSILLEFVEGGTMEDLFKGPHPTSSQEKLTFWRNLVRVLETLGRIHKHIHPDDPNGVIEGVHQDIKPANILVCKNSANHPFDYSFKVVDLGLTYFNVGDSHGAKYHKKDGRGTQTYSAPECFRDERDSYDQCSPREARPSKDIWSLGCVFSLALVWSVLGPERVNKYQSSLERATMHLTHLRASAYVGCFHNGEKVLAEVRWMHNEVLRACGRDDYFINEMVAIVTDMLDEVVDRPSAKMVRRRCRQAIQRADELTTSFPTIFLKESELMSRPRTPPEVPPGFGHSGLHIDLNSQPNVHASERPRSAEHSPSSPSGSFERSVYTRNPHNSIDTMMSCGSPISKYHRTSGRLSSSDLDPIHGMETKPHATIEEVLAAIEKKKNGVYNGTILRDLQSLPSLNDRDQIFLIDNSPSMQQHWPQVRKAFEALGYIVKCADPDGMELYFTNWNRGGRSRDRRKLLQLFQSVKLQGEGSIEPALSKILDEYTRDNPFTALVRKRRRVNIYILTDGIWTGEDGSLCGIDEAIKRTVKEKKMNTRNSMGIQFIQFGNNPTGTYRLNTLDDGLKDQDTIRDIIDHTHIDGNVFKMLLGSIDSWWDGQAANTSPAAALQQTPRNMAPNGVPF